MAIIDGQVKVNLKRLAENVRRLFTEPVQNIPALELRLTDLLDYIESL